MNDDSIDPLELIKQYRSQELTACLLKIKPLKAEEDKWIRVGLDISQPGNLPAGLRHEVILAVEELLEIAEYGGILEAYEHALEVLEPLVSRAESTDADSTLINRQLGRSYLALAEAAAGRSLAKELFTKALEAFWRERNIFRGKIGVENELGNAFEILGVHLEEEAHWHLGMLHLENNEREPAAQHVLDAIILRSAGRIRDQNKFLIKNAIKKFAANESATKSDTPFPSFADQIARQLREIVSDDWVVIKYRNYLSEIAGQETESGGSGFVQALATMGPRLVQMHAAGEKISIDQIKKDPNISTAYNEIGAMVARRSDASPEVLHCAPGDREESVKQLLNSIISSLVNCGQAYVRITQADLERIRALNPVDNRERARYLVALVKERADMAINGRILITDAQIKIFRMVGLKARYSLNAITEEFVRMVPELLQTPTQELEAVIRGNRCIAAVLERIVSMAALTQNPVQRPKKGQRRGR